MQQNQETETYDVNVEEQNETEEQPSAEVLRCSQCGARLKEDSKTCEFCGKKN